MARDSNSSRSSCYSSTRRTDGRTNRTSHKTSRREGRRRVRAMTHSYVGNLAERLVRDVRGVLLLGLCKVDNVEFVGDVALFGYQGHAACASGQRKSVKLQCHCERRGSQKGLSLQPTKASRSLYPVCVRFRMYKVLCHGRRRLRSDGMFPFYDGLLIWDV